MNVYDFDKTIFKSDSSVDYILFIIRKNPMFLLNSFRMIFYSLLYVLRIVDKTKFKENLFYGFKYVKNIDDLFNEFVEEYKYKIQDWYKDNYKEDDLIISASPYFLVKGLINTFNDIEVIASNVDKYTGKFDGLNCYGEEKVIRFKKLYDKEIINFYSDSYSDTPLARLSKKAYIVKDGNLIDWKF